MAGVQLSALQDVGNHGAVAGFPDLQNLVFAAANGDGLVAREEGAGAFREEVKAGIFRVQPFDKEILGIRMGGVNPQAIQALWPRMIKGTPGAVAPARSVVGVVSRARYQTPGVDIQR